MKKLIFLFIYVNTMFCYSQNEKENIPLDYVFSPGIIIQKDIFSEFNITIGDVSSEQHPKMPPIIGIIGYRIGLETNFKNKESFIIAPKIGYEISITFFTVRLSALNYFKNKQSEFRLLPELGLSIGGSINLTYGYGISIGNTINDISNHRLGLSFNINRRLNKALF